MIDGEVYVTTDTLYDYLNERFYWDQAENLLLYTTPTEVITAAVGSAAYSVGSQSYTCLLYTSLWRKSLLSGS